jgi:hypothetical protein
MRISLFIHHGLLCIELRVKLEVITDDFSSISSNRHCFPVNMFSFNSDLHCWAVNNPVSY